MFENKELQKLQKRIKTYERMEENRQTQKQYITCIDALEEEIKKVKKISNLLGADFSNQVKEQVKREVRFLLEKYDSPSIPGMYYDGINVIQRL